MTTGKTREPGPWVRLDAGRADIPDVLRLAYADMPETPFDSETVLAEGRRRVIRKRLMFGAAVFLIVTTCAFLRVTSRAG